MRGHTVLLHEFPSALSPSCAYEIREKEIRDPISFKTIAPHLMQTQFRQSVHRLPVIDRAVTEWFLRSTHNIYAGSSKDGIVTLVRNTLSLSTGQPRLPRTRTFTNVQSLWENALNADEDDRSVCRLLITYLLSSQFLRQIRVS